MKCAYKLWIDSQDGHKIFGDGPYLLLKGVQKKGSLIESARILNMSYSKASAIIKNAEKELGFDLLCRRVGGKNGGGSTITKEAKELLKRYELFRQKAALEIERVYLETFCNEL